MHRRVWLNLGVTVVLLLAATFSSLVLGGLIGGTANAQMLFLLAVLLIARFTDGYLWSVGASIVSVPLVNYMFTYPYFSFNLTISGYLLTFLTMLAVSLIVSVLTARIKQQEQIRLDAEREKLRANLLRAVSHDLRTPLTSIVGATGAILDNALPPEKQRELLADVNADAQWLLRMIENQLAITRIQGETAPLHTETEVVEDVLAEAAIKFQKHFPDIKVDMDLCDDILLADMDAVLIEQVVLNLLENAVYHGKHTTRVRLSAERSGRFVLVTVSDDGAGIDPEKIMNKARKQGILTKPESEYTEKEIQNLILLPGFSTNETVTEFSGRGVGMDVVKANVEKCGGSIIVDSKKGEGTTFIIKIPLTLAIIDGMEITVGDLVFTVPISTIRESFKAESSQILRDTKNNEMIMIRGVCYPILRMHEKFAIDTEITNLEDGILLLVETDNKSVCIFADKLIGEQQVVVKPFPAYLNKYKIKGEGLSGCTIMGDGSISLIIDTNTLIG